MAKVMTNYKEEEIVVSYSSKIITKFYRRKWIPVATRSSDMYPSSQTDYPDPMEDEIAPGNTRHRGLPIK